MAPKPNIIRDITEDIIGSHVATTIVAKPDGPIVGFFKKVGEIVMPHEGVITNRWGSSHRRIESNPPPDMVHPRVNHHPRKGGIV